MNEKIKERVNSARHFVEIGSSDVYESLRFVHEYGGENTEYHPLKAITRLRAAIANLNRALDILETGCEK